MKVAQEDDEYQCRGEAYARLEATVAMTMVSLLLATLVLASIVVGGTRHETAPTHLTRQESSAHTLQVRTNN